MSLPEYTTLYARCLKSVNIMENGVNVDKTNIHEDNNNCNYINLIIFTIFNILKNNLQLYIIIRYLNNISEKNLSILYINEKHLPLITTHMDMLESVYARKTYNEKFYSINKRILEENPYTIFNLNLFDIEKIVILKAVDKKYMKINYNKYLKYKHKYLNLKMLDFLKKLS